jgi:hypothetical protein
VESEPVVESGSEVAASEVASESVAESASEAVSEAGAESVSGEAIEEPVAADPVEPEPVTEPMADHAPELIETHAVAPEPIPAESEPEVVAEAAVAEYASAMPPTNELVSPVVEEAGLSPEPEAVAAEAPALIVTESMAELFLKQGHKELALAVYRQLTVRGPVSEQLSENMQQVEAEVAARGSASEHRRDYAARVTGGRSVESLLQGILKAEPPAPTSSVLPPAIEHATGEPSRQGPDTLPLSAVFGDEPVVAPRPESIASDPEPSFDEFFGAVPSPEPAPAGGERSAEAEDLRQFNEWLKGLKR